MGAARHVVQARHLCGSTLVLLLLVSHHVTVLPPVTLRNFSVLTFDLLFVGPLVIGWWRGQSKPERAISSVARVASGSSPVLPIGTIAAAAAVVFAGCYLAGPLTADRMHDAWFAALRPLLDSVQEWSLGFARIRELAAAAVAPGDAVLAGYNLVLLWIAPGLTLVAGFISRWLSMSAPRAAWQCAIYRARFTGSEVLRKTIDRTIVVLFVWNLPMSNAVPPGTSPAVEVLARSIGYLVVAGRPMVLLLLSCAAIEWLFAEIALGDFGRRHLSRPIGGRAGFGGAT